MSAVILYVTAPNAESAQQLARKLVDERLIACANILSGMTSIYRWQGQVEQGDEVAILLKTDIRRTDDVIARVQELHPYECPCVIQWPIAAGSAAYLQWISAESGPDDRLVT